MEVMEALGEGRKGGRRVDKVNLGHILIVSPSFYCHHTFRQPNNMPFHEITLNDGRKIPQIGFGSWKIPKDVCSGQVDQAIDVGFDHIDTAQGGHISPVANCTIRLTV